jgi:tetratricopeptide (TPR) repeat protein
MKPLEDQYNAYDATKREVDLNKRAAMMIEFRQKYPQSTFVQNINYDYAEMLKDASRGKQYELLESIAEKWLKIQSQDTNAYGYIAEAARNMQKYDKCGASLEEIYKMDPSSALARDIYNCYQKSDNSSKMIEWGERLGKMPEFADDYTLHFDLMLRYAKDENLSKAAEQAQLTLKTADLTKQTDANTKELLRKVHRASYHVIASDLMERKKFTEAIAAFKEAIKAERYGEGYYRIGLCLDNQRQIEEANLYYAMAELMGGEDAPKAKARLETLYKTLHNNTLIGVDKVYQKAKEALAEPDL